MQTFTLHSNLTAIRGYHVYKDVWPNPFVGEIVHCEREERNRYDPYAVALKKAGTGTVGHVPRTISCICTIFLRQGGVIVASVTGPRRYSADLEKGGLEIPCLYRFTGGEDSVKKAHYRLNAEQDGVGEIEGMYTIHVNKLLTVAFIVLVAEPADDTDGTADKSDGETRMTADTASASVPHVVTLVKTEPVDNDFPPQAIQNNVTWVKVKDISLTTVDKHLLTNGQKLSDKHINAAQRILKLMFPKINGLRLTLLQDKPHKESTENSLQIFHIEGDHWVCATTIGASGRKVLVYDSAYTRWSDQAISCVRKQFRRAAGNISIQKNVQKQRGGSECGLYAIANATSLAYGKDPIKMTYKESAMREHLCHCLSEMRLELFPTSE